MLKKLKAKTVSPLTEEEPAEDYTQNIIYNFTIHVAGDYNITVNGNMKQNSGKPAPFPPPH